MTAWGWEVYGHPAPQGSKNAYVRNGRAFLVESSKRLPGWRDAVLHAVRSGKRPEKPFTKVSYVDLSFRFPRPRSHYAKDGSIKPGVPTFHTSKPDLDKLIRGVLDALVVAEVLVDDAIVAWISAEKCYVLSDELPGCSIWISVDPDREAA